MKKTAVLLVFGIFLSLTSVSQANDVVGTWDFFQDWDSDGVWDSMTYHLFLYSDGTAASKTAYTDHEGTWKTEGNQIAIALALGTTFQGTITASGTGMSGNATGSTGKTALWMAKKPYVDNKDGTVTNVDKLLVWQQTGDKDKRNWEDATSYCSELVLGDNSNWRLPESSELRGLWDENRGFRAFINLVFDCYLGYYMSNTACGTGGNRRRLWKQGVLLCSCNQTKRFCKVRP